MSGPSLLLCSFRHLKGPLAGVLFCCSECQALKVLSSLLFSCRCWCVGRERLQGWLRPLHIPSSITLPSGLPGFPPQAFPTTVSSILSLWAISLHSTADLTQGLLHNHYTPAPSQPLCLLGDLHPVWNTYGKNYLCDSHCI